MTLPDYKLLGSPIRIKAKGKVVGHYYQQYRLLSDPPRKLRRAPCVADKTISRKKATHFVETHLRKTLGDIDPVAKHSAATIDEHLAVYIEALKADARSKSHIQNEQGRIRRITSDLKWSRIEQVSGLAIKGWIADKRDNGEWITRGKDKKVNGKVIKAKRVLVKLSVKTGGYYLRSYRSFTAFLVRNKRIGSDPLQYVRMGTKGDLPKPARQRRALSGDELSRLCQAAKDGPEVKGLTGLQRSMLWRLMAGCGLRCHEASSLTPRSFDFAAPPTVMLDKSFSKRRKHDVLELPQTLADQFQEWMEGMDKDAPIFPGNWWSRAAEALAVDLRAALIEIETDQGICDAHSMRTSFITAVSQRQDAMLSQHQGQSGEALSLDGGSSF
jgi:integrase